MKTTYVLNDKNELVVKGSSEDNKARYYVQGDLEAFLSPIDGSIVHSRSSLRTHNERHGVVNSAEYSPEYYERKAVERASVPFSKKAREERTAALSQAYDEIKPAKSHLDYVLDQNARMNNRRN